MNDRIVKIIAQYERWDKNREALAEREDSDNPPRANEWHWSDDEAVDILHDLVREVQAEMEFQKGFNDG